jgi:uncharacterized protein YndB with AHSA1/START domain
MNRTKAAAETIVEEITINAPAERVFDAFASERVAWWHVDGRFHTTHAESDLRPGGRWSMGGTRADGMPFTVKGEYRAVDRPRLLVFTWLPDWQPDATESEVRVEFKEERGATHVRLTHSGLTTETSRQSHRGWPQILGLMRAYLERR